MRGQTPRFSVSCAPFLVPHAQQGPSRLLVSLATFLPPSCALLRPPFPLTSLSCGATTHAVSLRHGLGARDRSRRTAARARRTRRIAAPSSTKAASSGRRRSPVAAAAASAAATAASCVRSWSTPQRRRPSRQAPALCGAFRRALEIRKRRRSDVLRVGNELCHRRLDARRGRWQPTHGIFPDELLPLLARAEELNS